MDERCQMMNPHRVQIIHGMDDNHSRCNMPATTTAMADLTGGVSISAQGCLRVPYVLEPVYNLAMDM
jgi:hypothetical protein